MTQIIASVVLLTFSNVAPFEILPQLMIVGALSLRLLGLFWLDFPTLFVARFLALVLGQIHLLKFNEPFGNFLGLKNALKILVFHSLFSLRSQVE